MAVYDCFLFFNELDLLEIRLNELNDVVDKFVLVESSLTHSSKKKPYYFEESKDRFKDFLHKIVHIKVDDTPNIPARPGRMGTFHNRHDIEWFQRDCASRGLISCSDDDLILLSDVDEIPRPESVMQTNEILLRDENSIVSFKQKLYYYYINGLCMKGSVTEPWWGTTACLYKRYPGAQNMRNTKASNKNVINDGGWHFSYIGGADSIALKIESFSHAEFDNEAVKDRNRLNKVIESGMDLFERHDKPRQTYIQLDQSFPRHLLNNKEKFSHLIKEPK
jgi:beta-1,4-mannosyl-glycoprotein beta-1,4-N-acetylglucosaminyltransferase